MLGERLPIMATMTADFLDWQEKEELKIYRILSLIYSHESSMCLNPLKIIKWLGQHAAFGHIFSPIAHY